MTSKQWLQKFFSLVSEDELNTMNSSDLCCIVDEEGVCFGLDCKDCPLANMNVLKCVVFKGEKK